MKALPPELQPLWREATKALSEERFGEAAALLQWLLRGAPAYTGGWNNLGVALRRLQRWEAAAICFRRGLSLPNGDVESAWSNLGNALHDLGRFAEADLAFQRAVAKGGFHGTRYNYSLLLRDMNRLDEAVAMIAPTIEAYPGNAQRRWDHALMLLQTGQWEEGFAAYEARWQLPGVPKFSSDRPVWDGSPLAGRTLLLPPSWRGVGLVAIDAPLPPHDVVLPMVSLARVLWARPDALPPPLSFAAAEPFLAEAAKAFPPRLGRRRIGIVWAGSPGHSNDRNRSTVLPSFLPLFAHPATDLYSFQIGDRAQDLTMTGFGAMVSNLSSPIGDFLDTAAYLRQIDLLVAVDTSTVHLAGSLGVPTVAMVPHAVDWRWGGAGTTTPWYASLRLARQPAQGDWAGPSGE